MPPNKHNYTTRAHRFRFRVSPNVLQQNSKLIATKAHLVLRNTTRPTRKEKSRSWFARWCECVRCCAASKRPTKPTKVYFWKGRDRFFSFCCYHFLFTKYCVAIVIVNFYDQYQYMCVLSRPIIVLEIFTNRARSKQKERRQRATANTTTHNPKKKR